MNLKLKPIMFALIICFGVMAFEIFLQDAHAQTLDLRGIYTAGDYEEPEPYNPIADPLWQLVFSATSRENCYEIIDAYIDRKIRSCEISCVYGPEQTEEEYETRVNSLIDHYMAIHQDLMERCNIVWRN